MSDLFHSIGVLFGGYDVFTYAVMAAACIGAGMMMQSIASIVNATLGALVVFAFLVFLRDAMNTPDAATLARTDWQYVLTLQLQTLTVYALVFGVLISLVYALHGFARR
jgi:hypothetical protein